jgi:hypothetical protein
LYNVLINPRSIREKRITTIEKIGAKSLPTDFVYSGKFMPDDSLVD